MQRLQALQNPHFGTKTKIPKNMLKSILQIIYSCSVQKKPVKIHSTNHLQLFCAKKPLQKALNIRETTPFSKSQIMQRLQPMQHPHFGSKIKIQKNMSKSILQIINSCSIEKTTPKNTKYSKHETIFKNGHHAKAIAHAKS